MNKNQVFYYKKNRLQQLKCFYYTALLGQPTKAAETIGITQSAVSMQIKSLEYDLNNQLFTRHKKKLTLTKEGTNLYEIITPHLQAIENVIDLFNQNQTKQKNNLIRIAANHVSISYILPKVIKQTQNFNNNIKFSIKNINKNEGIERLLKNEVDMLLYPSQKHEIPMECDFHPVKTFQPILLLRSDDPIASKSELKLSDIRYRNIVRIDPNLITLPGFEDVLKSNDIDTNIEFENGDWEILKKFVKAKIGVAIISNICIETHDNLIGIPLNQYFPQMTYGILTKKGSKFTESQNYFIKKLKECYEESN
ncbi:MAG: LysR family transcriptional regulator [Rickettsiales bacterium]|nr:LysR family transcriptional regulator [Rickettsiales bacterium]